MGVIRRGILGGFSGSVGNVVGSSWKGIATMKAKPLSVANPNTAGQIAQRTKMSNIVSFLKPMLADIIKPLNDRFASGQSGYNLFVQRNIALFNQFTPDPPSSLILSSGNVARIPAMTVTADQSANTISATWVDDTGTGNALADDECFVVAVNRTQSTRVYEGVAATRADEAFSVSTVGWVAGNTYDIWVSMRRADGSQVSDTRYQTGLVVA